MTVATFGPPVRIDGPLPVAPTFSLINTAQVLNDTVTNPTGEGYLVTESQDVFRAGNGAIVYPYPVDTGFSFDPCSTGTFRVKEDGTAAPLPTFAAFTAYLPETCSSSRIVSPDYFRARAQLAFAAVESSIYENVLATGGILAGGGQPYLGDTNLVVLGGGAVSPKEGLALLEDAIGRTGRRGMIHATPSTVSAWTFFGDAVREVGGALQSGRGQRVVCSGFTGH